MLYDCNNFDVEKRLNKLSEWNLKELENNQNSVDNV